MCESSFSDSYTSSSHDTFQLLRLTCDYQLALHGLFLWYTRRYGERNLHHFTLRCISGIKIFREIQKKDGGKCCHVYATRYPDHTPEVYVSATFTKSSSVLNANISACEGS